MIAPLTVLGEIHEDWAVITDADIRRVQRRLEKIQPNEKPLGTLHDEALKKMWALAERYEGLSQVLLNDANFTADTEEQTAELLQKSKRYSSLGEIVRNAFWCQAQDDIGAAAWQPGQDIGLRADWMLVSVQGGPLPRILSGIVRRMEE